MTCGLRETVPKAQSEFIQLYIKYGTALARLGDGIMIAVLLFEMLQDRAHDVSSCVKGERPVSIPGNFGMYCIWLFYVVLQNGRSVKHVC